MATYRAVWNGTVIAESDDTVVVDGYRYFPAATVRGEYLASSAHHSVCGWKGQASYYDVIVDGDRNRNAAWYYPDPKPGAETVGGRLGFWHGVRVEAATSEHAEGSSSLDEPSVFSRLRRRARR